MEALRSLLHWCYHAIVRYAYRPFDVRWLYWEPETNLLDRERSDYFPQVFEGNVWLSAGQRNRKEAFYQPQFATRLVDHHIVESNASLFPLFLQGQEELMLDSQPAADSPQANLAAEARQLVCALGSDAQALFFHSLAILHSPAYREENEGALRQDWPRVPLAAEREILQVSAELGGTIASLLDSEMRVEGVTSGALRPELQIIGLPARVGGGSLDPGAGDLCATAGWGHAGQGGVTMPGKGRLIERNYSEEELAAMTAGTEELGMSAEHLLNLLGGSTFDVYMNEVAYWRNIPAGVWSYTIGGYQVIKKWLSYREYKLLNRSLTSEEIREVMNIARRIAAILLMGPALDENYRTVKESTCEWPPSA